MNKTSNSYSLLDEKVRKWIWRQGWTSLKDIQENAIPLVLAGDRDVIISASTAGGKTEAAFLPILTSILRDPAPKGYQVLYVSPLKALINDQYKRLVNMTSGMDLSVTPWHGDIDFSRKKRSLKEPNGIIIITPESLESFFINKKEYVLSTFSSLKYVVIDELHSFIGTERGKQLQSLLCRLEQIVRRHIPRIAMSATFSDYDSVKQFLRNDGALPCAIPPQGDSNHEIKVLVKEYIRQKDKDVTASISEEIYTQLRGSNNLVFTNTRAEAEIYALRAIDLCAANGVPNEFRVHHGSLSKTERESVERDLQCGKYPVTAFCTSTMELGIDIGKVKSIAQIGTANSISGLRQRLGRSGRRNEPSILRVFSIEDMNSGLLYDLHANLVQNIAVIELMREHRYEVSATGSYHLSTLIQQILAVIAQFGCFYPKEGWLLLCDKGAFKNISPELFLIVLRSLGANNVISQLNTGQIVIGEKGEELLKAPDFYVAFNSPVDLTVVDKSTSKRIGTIQFKPTTNTVIILAGKRWMVDSWDEKIATIYVSPIKHGGVAQFNGDGIDTDRLITLKMRDIYMSDTIYAYLDKRTKCSEALEDGRLFFQKNNAAKNSFIQYGNNIYFLTWAGSKVNRTISLIAEYRLGKSCPYGSFFVENITSQDIEKIKSADKPNGEELAKLKSRPVKITQKYDYLLSEDLLNQEYANSHLDIEMAWIVLTSLPEI